MIEGYIDEKNLLWVNITVIGEHGEAEVAAMVDTGFTGELWLPLDKAVTLGLKLSGVGTAELADGSTSNQMLFSAHMKFGSVEKPITVTVIKSGPPLLGGGLLHGYVLKADYKERRLYIEEPS
jgi:clan AA aspartic protease